MNSQDLWVHKIVSDFRICYPISVTKGNGCKSKPQAKVWLQTQASPGGAEEEHKLVQGPLARTINPSSGAMYSAVFG